VVNRLLRKVVDIRRNELGTALLMFTYSFLAMSAYNILKPLTRSKFIAQLGADNIPYVQLAAGLLIGVLMHGYGHAIRRLPRRLVIPVTQAALVALLVITWGLFRTGAAWVPVAFYVLGLVLGIFLISQFWTLANDLYDARQAKRLFGFIGGGASLGGATGAGITALAVKEVGADNLLLVSAAILAVCVGLVLAITNSPDDVETTTSLDDQQGVGGREAIRLLRTSRHVQVVALVIGCAAIGAGIIEQQLNMAAEAMTADGAAESLAAFFAAVTFYLSVIGFVVQVSLTSRIHRSYGLAFALLLLPVSLGLTGIVILLSGALWAAAVARVLDSTLRYTIDKTTREVLFLPLPADLKYRAKPFLDVTVDRLGKALSAVLLLVLIKPWGLGLNWRQLSYASVTMTAIWIAAALAARRHYRQSFRASIGSQAIAPDAVRAVTADAATIETLIEELSNPDEGAVLYAIEMLEALDKRNLVSPLLLHHTSARVRARALMALHAGKARTVERWTPLVTRLLADDDTDVRAAAMQALSVLRHEDATDVMRRCLHDVEPRIAVTAAVALADSGTPADIAAAAATLRGFIDDARETTAPARREVAAGLARVRNPAFRDLLVPLLYDRSTAVAGAAIAAARTLGAADGLFVPALVSHLGNRSLKAAARDTLISYGDAMLDALGTLLRDQREHVWIRRHLPATIAATPSFRARDILMESLDDPDAFLRYKVLQALEEMSRTRPDLTPPRSALEAQVLKESTRYFIHLTLQAGLMPHVDGARPPLVARALDDTLGRTLDRLYRLLGMMCSPDGVCAARYAIEHGDARRRAAAVEYLDNLLGGAVRKRMMTIVEDMSAEQRVHCASAIIKARPRRLEDTLLQLIHDDDPVLAATAIHFIATRHLWSFAADLEFVATRRPDQPYVAEAAFWAMAMQTNPGWIDTARLLPAVDIADRLRELEMFASAPVDELFRIAEAGQQVVTPAGRQVDASGRIPNELHVLLAGRVSASGDVERRIISAPAAIAFDHAIQRTPLRSTLTAVDRVVLLRLERDQFLTMLADNPTLAQGVFRMLLGSARPLAVADAQVASSGFATDGPVQAIDKVLLLRQHAWLDGASFRQLHALAGAACDVPLDAGRPLVTRGEAPAIYQVLQGDVLLQSDTAAPVRLGPGAVFGLAETLTDTGWTRDATPMTPGRALRLSRDDVWMALADVGLLESLLCGALAMHYDAPVVAASPREPHAHEHHGILGAPNDVM
jgi:AAA family ATP:ADP antiporter